MSRTNESLLVLVWFALSWLSVSAVGNTRLECLLALEYEAYSWGYSPSKTEPEAKVAADFVHALQPLPWGGRLITSKWSRQLKAIKGPSELTDELLGALMISIAQQRLHQMRWRPGTAQKQELFDVLKDVFVINGETLSGGLHQGKNGTQIFLVTLPKGLHPLLEVTIELHEWEHAVQNAWAIAQESMTERLILNSSKYPMIKYVKERMAIQLEAVLLGSIPKKVRRKIWEQERQKLEGISPAIQNLMAHRLLGDTNNQELFIQTSQRLRSYLYPDLVDRLSPNPPLKKPQKKPY